MNAATAHRFVIDHDLTTEVEQIADQAPPLPEHVAAAWRRALSIAPTNRPEAN